LYEEWQKWDASLYSGAAGFLYALLLCEKGIREKYEDDNDELSEPRIIRIVKEIQYAISEIVYIISIRKLVKGEAVEKTQTVRKGDLLNVGVTKKAPVNFLEVKYKGKANLGALHGTVGVLHMMI
jgi:hypothetical protein